MRLKLHSEELSATKTSQLAGEVELRKVVHEKEQQIPVTLNTAALAPGDYFATVTIRANTADEKAVAVPVHVTVMPLPAEIAIYPPAVNRCRSPASTGATPGRTARGLENRCARATLAPTIRIRPKPGTWM